MSTRTVYISKEQTIGTDQWTDRQSKNASKTGRTYQQIDSVKFSKPTDKCWIVTVSSVAGGIIGGVAAGVPTFGAGAPGGAIGGAALGGIIGVAIAEVIEKCEKNKSK